MPLVELGACQGESEPIVFRQMAQFQTLRGSRIGCHSGKAILGCLRRHVCPCVTPVGGATSATGAAAPGGLLKAYGGV